MKQSTQTTTLPTTSLAFSKPPPKPLPRWSHWIVWCVAGVTFLICGLQDRRRVLHTMHLAVQNYINDFDRWMHMLPGFLFAHKPMIKDLWPMPPTTLGLLAPFAWVSPANAQLIWALCKLPMVMLIFYLCRSMVRKAGSRFEWPALLLLGLIWFWPIIGDVQEGQMNLFMLTPMVIGLWLAQLDEAWANWPAGFMLALAVCIKVTPIIFLVYMLWRRRWSVATAMVVGMAFWIFGFGTLCFGWSQNLAWWHQWTNIMITPYVLKGTVAVSSGESIPSFLNRLLTHTPAFVSLAGGKHINHYCNVLSLPEPIARHIIRGLLVAVGIVGLIWMRRPLPSLRCRRYILELGAIAAFMLWAEEWSWVPHYVTLVLTLSAAVMILCDVEATAAARRRVLYALFAAAVLMLFTSDIDKLFGHNGPNWGRTMDPVLFAGIILVWAIMFSGYPDAIARRIGEVE
ncbi:MAG: DUF2029 domain-containing protein [Phycisphaerales bacterium]|nr:DUF2029 domain-containing protein [Phycisphaerales bacterium]